MTVAAILYTLLMVLLVLVVAYGIIWFLSEFSGKPAPQPIRMVVWLVAFILIVLIILSIIPGNPVWHRQW